jgi:Alpha/beta hydrolase domain
MGWNYRAAGFGEGDLCDLTGSFIPFAGTQAQRIANGDPRLSLHERYGNNTGYVAAVTAAANNLVSEGLLLPDDATSIINTAKSVSIP